MAKKGLKQSQSNVQAAALNNHGAITTSSGYTFQHFVPSTNPQFKVNTKASTLRINQGRRPDTVKNSVVRLFMELLMMRDMVTVNPGAVAPEVKDMIPVRYAF